MILQKSYEMADIIVTIQVLWVAHCRDKLVVVRLHCFVHDGAARMI